MTTTTYDKTDGLEAAAWMAGYLWNGIQSTGDVRGYEAQRALCKAISEALLVARPGLTNAQCAVITELREDLRTAMELDGDMLPPVLDQIATLLRRPAFTGAV